jgi:hypothetical protein
VRSLAKFPWDEAANVLIGAELAGGSFAYEIPEDKRLDPKRSDIKFENKRSDSKPYHVGILWPAIARNEKCLHNLSSDFPSRPQGSRTPHILRCPCEPS